MKKVVIPDYMWPKVWMVLVSAVALAAALGVFYLGQQSTAHHQARYAQCEYLGSRIQGGFWSSKIYSYDCNGIIEETNLRPPDQKR